jgi:hypothetical protein
MKFLKFVVLAVLLMFASASFAQHRGGGHPGGGHYGHGGSWVAPLIIGGAIGYYATRPYYAPQPVYYPPWYYNQSIAVPPPVIYAPPPVQYVERPPVATVQLWCDQPRMWYAPGASCNVAWREIVTTQ